MNDLNLKKAKLREVTAPISIQQHLIKHLSENEKICPDCEGSGVTLATNVFYKTTYENETLPFNVEAFTFCHTCYNGVVKICMHCGECLIRNSSCTCAIAKEVAAETENLESLRKWNQAKKMDLHTYQKESDSSIVYLDNTNTYFDSSELADYLVEQNAANVDVTTLRFYGVENHYITLNAEDIVENASEELHEDATISSKSMEELTIFLSEWVERNKQDTHTIYPDYRLAILLPQM